MAVARPGLCGGTVRLPLAPLSLEQPANDLVSRFEDGRAHQYLQVGDGPSCWILGFKLGDQPLDLFVLRKEDLGRGGLFFNPAANSARCSARGNSWNSNYLYGLRKRCRRTGGICRN